MGAQVLSLPGFVRFQQEGVGGRLADQDIGEVLAGGEEAEEIREQARIFLEGRERGGGAGEVGGPADQVRQGHVRVGAAGEWLRQCLREPQRLDGVREPPGDRLQGRGRPVRVLKE